MRNFFLVLMTVALAASCFATVTISSPASGSTVSSPVHVVAYGTNGTNAMILYVDNNKQYTANSTTLDTTFSLSTGTHSLVVSGWDNSGNVTQAKESITVGSSSTSTSTSGSYAKITSPSSGASVNSPFTLNASASTANGVSGWVVYSDGNNVYQVNNGSTSLSASVSLSSGTHSVFVRAWDKVSGYVSSPTISITVGSSSGSTSTSSTDPTIYNINTQSGWNSCSSCAGDGGSGPVASYYSSQWVSSPSLDGKSMKFAITSTPAWGAVLWYKGLTSQISSPGTKHHFIYDTYVYLNNSSAVQALEFDINQYVNGHQLIFGTQCDVRGGNVWDIYDNQGHKWVHTGAYCPTLSAYTWHHVIVEVERTSGGGDYLHYISITLDGTKHYIDKYYPPTSSSWNVITINYQMDANGSGTPYTTWLDKTNFSYW
ncbi:MAG: Ig-like domain-containing protein [Terriglobales bacterium]